jgi:hypothetical protein
MPTTTVERGTDLSENQDLDDVDLEDLEESVRMTPTSLGGAARAASRDAALDSGIPVLLLHREHANSALLREVASEIQRTTTPTSLAMGWVIELPRFKPSTNANTEFDDLQGVSLRIADPVLYARGDQWGPMLLQERDGANPNSTLMLRPLMTKNSTQWDYFNTAIPSPRDRWITQVLDAQRVSGANLLLTPGLPLDSSNPQDSLDAARGDLDFCAASLHSGERLAWNITVTHEWLTSTRLRAMLLEEIVDSAHDVLYLRVKWPLASSTYAQLLDVDVLVGYKEISSLASDEQRTLLLPNTGGTGWINVALGASGYGLGIGSRARAFATHRFAPIGGATKPARYFERRIIHTITKVVDDALSGLPGYVACDCTFCDQLRTRATWNQPLSGAHHVLRMAHETAVLAQSGGRGPRSVARRRVRGCQQYVSAVGSTVPLVGSDNPAHLALWADLLS